jgi:hypothetical protein
MQAYARALFPHLTRHPSLFQCLRFTFVVETNATLKFAGVTATLPLDAADEKGMPASPSLTHLGKIVQNLLVLEKSIAESRYMPSIVK